MRIDRRQIVKIAAWIFIWRLSFDLLDACQPRSGALLGRLRGPAHKDSFAKCEFLDQRCGYVWVGSLGCVVAGRVPQKAKPLGVKFQDTLDVMRVVRHEGTCACGLFVLLNAC